MRRSSAKNDWQMTIYIPRQLRREDPIAQLRQLAQEQRHSVNFLVVEAIRSYLRERQQTVRQR